jgi:hypothetical protein
VLSCTGRVLTKDLWIRFIEGFSREPEESLRLEENLELSYADIGPRVGGLRQKTIQKVE